METQRKDVKNLLYSRRLLMMLRHCRLGDIKGIWSVKKLDVGLLVDDLTGALHILYYSYSCHHHFHYP